MTEKSYRERKRKRKENYCRTSVSEENISRRNLNIWSLPLVVRGNEGMEGWRPKGVKDRDNEHEFKKDCEKGWSAEGWVGGGKKDSNWIK